LNISILPGADTRNFLASPVVAFRLAGFWQVDGTRKGKASKKDQHHQKTEDSFFHF
jgi:hypothetical protein